jgi:hypothetical protein
MMPVEKLSGAHVQLGKKRYGLYLTIFFAGVK